MARLRLFMLMAAFVASAVHPRAANALPGPPDAHGSRAKHGLHLGWVKALPDLAVTSEDQAVRIPVLVNDERVLRLHARITAVTNGAFGATRIDEGRIVYTPRPDRNGVDRFTYTITDRYGRRSSAMVTVKVRPVNDPPTVTVSADQRSGGAPLDVTFSAAGADVDGDALGYSWDFGDGGAASGASVTHRYSSAGTFAAKVVASDRVATAEATTTVTVTAVTRPTAYVVQPVAGTGVPGEAGEGGPATQAQLTTPRRVAVTPDGTVYIVDVGRISRVDAAGSLTRVRSFVSADAGPSIAVGPNGSLYYTESDVSGWCSEGGWYSEIRVKELTQGGADPVVARLTAPGGFGDCESATALAVDDQGLFYIGSGSQVVAVAAGGTSAIWEVLFLDVVNSMAAAPGGGVYVGGFSSVAAIDPNGVMTPFAGTGVHGTSGDGGPALQATLGSVGGIAVEEDGTVSLLEFDFYTTLPWIRQVRTDGTIVTIGGGAYGFDGDGRVATSTAFAFFWSGGFAAAPDGSLVLADSGNERVRRLVGQ